MCPGKPETVSKGTPLVVMGNTSGASDKFMTAATIGNCIGGATLFGPDLVYAVTPTASGMLTASLNANYTRPWLHVRTSCPGTPADEISCEYGQNAGTLMAPTVAVTGGSTYYVVADSWQNGSGTFTLTVTLQ
jgi:hypothetical protein